VTINDRMQQGYSCELTAAIGRDFHPEFQPDLSPKKMLQLGVFEASISTIAGSGLRGRTCRPRAATGP
jgi:hypothetical protein